MTVGKCSMSNVDLYKTYKTKNKKFLWYKLNPEVFDA